MASCLPANSDCCCSGYTISSADLQTMIDAAVLTAITEDMATVLAGFVFTNVAALRASTVHPNNCPAIIETVTTPGDGSVGLYTYDSTSTAADSVPNVIEPDDVGPAAPGRWLKRI